MMVARSESMFGCYDSYSYRLWSLANVWSTCHFPTLTNGVTKDTNENASNTTEPYVKCPQCQKGYTNFQALKEHLEFCHPNTVPSEEGSLVPPPAPPAAVAAASPPPAPLGPGGPYACTQCTTSFATKDQLDKHELLHSPSAQVSCKVCHKTFANVYRLQRHMISHDESAILRKFKCTECEKAFKFKHHLKEHIRIHSGEKPFECANCGKRFSHSGSYSSHMTSKKCLVMNLKMGRNRATAITSSLLDKNHQALTNRVPKRIATSLNNNITTSPNHNSYLPIMPKYSEAAAAAFLSVMSPRDSPYPPAPTQLHPFYMTSPALHPISPYTMSASLGQLLEQLQTSHKSHQISEPVDHESRPLSAAATEDEPKAPSVCSDLIMDTDEGEKDEDNQRPQSRESNSGDLEAVKRILETVNATVTKQLLQANMQKFSTDSPNSPSISPSLPTDDIKQRIKSELYRSDYGNATEIKREGLAAKLEEDVQIKAEGIKSEEINGNVSGTDEEHNEKIQDDFEIDNESITTTDHVSEDGRKVRVRSLIADEQLTILKDHYALNPRPKREELARIADRIGFPVRVVQVWFQNTRARDRREGRLVHIPYSPIPNCFPQTLVPSVALRTMPFGQASPHYHQTSSEQPLDLSTKKGPLSISSSSPASSPQRPASVVAHSDSGEEAVNLSHKSSRSPTPFHQLPYQPTHYQSSNCSSDYHRSPSPTFMHHHDTFTNGSRLARILTQPAHRLTAAGVSSAMALMHYNPELKSPLTNLASISPNSEKRSWKLEDNEDSGVSQEMYNADEDIACPAKRKKPNLALKGLNSALLTANIGETEIEGQFICDQCDKAFSKQSSLARHKYEHSGQRPHQCNECPKAFKHKHHLTEHKRLHSGEKPFQCSKCLKRFSHSGSYSQHMNHRYSYCKPYRE